MARKKQLHLVGTEPKRIAELDELDELGETLVETRETRMKLTSKEVTDAAALVTAMQKHKVDVYKLENGKTLTLDSKTKVKVKTEKDEADDLD